MIDVPFSMQGLSAVGRFCSYSFSSCVSALRLPSVDRHTVQGMVVQALKYAQGHKVVTIKPEAFVSRAAETGV